MFKTFKSTSQISLHSFLRKKKKKKKNSFWGFSILFYFKGNKPLCRKIFESVSKSSNKPLYWIHVLLCSFKLYITLCSIDRLYLFIYILESFSNSQCIYNKWDFLCRFFVFCIFVWLVKKTEESK